MDTENFNDFNLKKNDIFHPHILNQNTQYNMQKGYY